MDRALHVTCGEEGERVARVHGERPVLGLHPAPFARRVILDLKGGDRLPEQQREGAQVCAGLSQWAVGGRYGGGTPVCPRPQSPFSLAFSSGVNLVYFMYRRWSYANLSTRPKSLDRVQLTSLFTSYLWIFLR